MSAAQNNWSPNDGHVIQKESAKKDFDKFLEICFENRANVPPGVVEYIKSQYNRWENCSAIIGLDSPLMFYEYAQYRKAKNNVVLGDPAHEKRIPKLITVFRNAPQSLRDIEETTAFEV